MPFVSFDPFRPWHWGTVNVPATRGPMRPQSMEVYARQRLPTDSIGNFTLTLTNLVVGSAVRIEIAGTGALVEYRVAANATEVFTVPAYSVGSSNNDLRIKVRKGTTAPKYQPLETFTTAFVGSGSVYIAQVPDPIA